MKTLKNGKYVETNENVEEQIPIEIRIIGLKQNLADTDYKAIKTSEKFLIEIIKVLIELCAKNDVDVADVKSVVENYSGIDLQRQEWRDEINRLESEAVTDGVD